MSGNIVCISIYYRVSWITAGSVRHFRWSGVMHHYVHKLQCTVSSNMHNYNMFQRYTALHLMSNH